MKPEEHRKLRELCQFQHWLGTNYKTLPTDSVEMTQRASKYVESLRCKHCELDKTSEGHDGCLGTLIGVMNACCGHGRETSAYVQFIDGKCVRGKEALVIQHILKNNSVEYKIDSNREIVVKGERVYISDTK